MISREEILDKCSEIEKEFIEKVKGITWQPKGLFFTEGLLFCAFCELLEVECIIESGVRNGMSTEIWLNYFDNDMEIHSIDMMDHTDDVEAAISRLNHHENITFHVGDGAELVEKLSSSIDKNIGILFDGPKSTPAINSLTKCANRKNVMFGSIHDMGKTAKEIHDKSFSLYGKSKNKQYSDSIDLLNQWKKKVFSSDDQEVVDSHFHINDELCSELNEDWLTYKEKYPSGCGLVFSDLRTS